METKLEAKENPFKKELFSIMDECNKKEFETKQYYGDKSTQALQIKKNHCYKIATLMIKSKQWRLYVGFDYNSDDEVPTLGLQTFYDSESSTDESDNTESSTDEPFEQNIL